MYDGYIMKKNTFNPLDIIKAQVSNKSAENCKDMKKSSLVVILIALIFVTAFPYVRQRVATGLTNSDASQYPGLGAALIKAAKVNSNFYVEGDELNADFSIDNTKLDDWTIVFTETKTDDYLLRDKSLNNCNVLIFGKSSILINCVTTGKKLSSTYKVIPDFSAEQIIKASKDTDTMVVYIQALLFSMSTGDIPSAIIMMILLITLQTLLFIVAISLFLSYSKKQSYDKKDSAKKYGFVNSLKIVATIAILPCVIVSAISYYYPSFGLSLGWVVYSFVLGLRVVLLYLGRVRVRDTRPVV